MNKKFTFHYRYLDVDYEQKSKIRYQRLKWAKETFGPTGVNRSWFVRTYATPTNYGINDLRDVFYFKDEKYATLFCLRWT